jgi:hypothetical protein
MADFLTRLANRTLGLAPVAEPVIAPMLAPDPSLPAMTGLNGPLDASQEAGEPAVTRSVLPTVSSPEDMARPVVPRPRPDPADARLAQQSAGESMRRAATVAPDAAIGRDIPTQRSPERTTAASRAADEDGLLMPPADALRHPSLVGTSKPVETPLSAQAASANPSRTPSMWPEEPVAASGWSAARQGSSVPPRDVEAEELLLPLSPVEVVSMRRDARAAVTPADEPDPTRSAERGQAAAAATPPPPPTIEITIGRVEVRAVHPPAPVARPQPAASTAPRLSLEEYLRNQNGGRR